MKTKNKNQKTYVFIDATNIIYGASRLGWRVDFQKLIKYLKERFEVEKVFYYAGLDQENIKQLKFYEKMQEFGYLLRLVPVKKFADGQKKADVDSRMTFEMMLHFNSYQKVIVMTGDGDYYWVLEYLLNQEKPVILLSFLHQTARELKRLIGADVNSLENLKKLVRFKVKK